MKHVTDQRKRKWWLAPLALCLAACLAMQPVGLNVVQAGEDEVSAFWTAVDAFWSVNTAFNAASDALFWGNEEEGITGAMGEYYDAEDIEARDAARKKVQDAIVAYEAAYPEVEPAFEEVTVKFEALTDDEKTEKDESDEEAMSIEEIYGLIDKNYNGDVSDDYVAIEARYQDSCKYIKEWYYNDSIDQYREACDGYFSASDALYGKYEEDTLVTPGAMQAYDEARDKGGDMDAAREAVLEAADGVKEAYAAMEEAYTALEEAYKNLPEDMKSEKEEEYTGETDSKQNLDNNYKEFRTYINIWEYTNSIDAYWKARELFPESTNAFLGNEQENIDGAYPTYMAVLESGAENLDALYAEVLAARAAVEEACETLTEKYQAENVAYNALTEEDQQASYGDTTVAAIHEDIVSDYTIGWVPETYKNCEEAFRNLDIKEYTNSNDAYWEARDLFWKAANNFLGNEQENITGAHPTYMSALESEAENLDALYEEVLAARAAVEEAYKTLTEKYQAENAAYEALTDKQAPYGDTTPAEIHTENVNDYTGWVAETYKIIREYDIPAPPQKEDPVPTPAPTTLPQDDPVATPTPAPTTPPQDDPAATPTPAPTTPPQDDPAATPTPAPTTPPQDVPVATPTPVPAKPSGQGSAAPSASAQEPVADWNVVYKDVENSVVSGKAQNIVAQAGTKFQVNGNILDKLAGSKTALFLNTGTGLSFSISGGDVPQGVPSLKVAMAAADGIPEAAKQSVLTGAMFSRAFAMEDKSAYPIKIDVHLNVGKENAGKTAYLYYYDESTGRMKLAGSFKATEAGQAMFAINRGDEYIVVVANSVATQHGSYTVAPGDTLSRIAARNGISLKQLLQANPGIKNPNKIYSGDVINLN